MLSSVRFRHGSSPQSLKIDAAVWVSAVVQTQEKTLIKNFPRVTGITHLLNLLTLIWFVSTNTRQHMLHCGHVHDKMQLHMQHVCQQTTPLPSSANWGPEWPSQGGRVSFLVENRGRFEKKVHNTCCMHINSRHRSPHALGRVAARASVHRLSMIC